MLCTKKNSIRHHSFVCTQLHDRKGLFQIIQFRISTHFKCQTVLFDLLIGSYQMLPLRHRLNLGAIAIKRYFSFLKEPALQEPHHQIVLSHNRTLGWRSLAQLQRCSRCIPQHQPSGPQDNRWGVLSFYRDSAVLFYIPNQLGHRTLVRESYPSTEMHPVCSAALADWATEHSLGSLTLLQRCSRCILQS